jgi:sugar lactone lactonase YvrE
MKTHNASPRTFAFLLTYCSVAISAWCAPPEDPVYPRVNPAPWYQVEASWPSGDLKSSWAAVPGVAVDQQGRVWVFTRSKPSVQVYSTEGTPLFAWGDMPGAHHIEIDKEGYVWTTDTQRHTVRKHEEDGTVLLTLGVDGEAGNDDDHFFKPTDVAVAGNGDIFVSDGYGNARVVHFKSDGTFVKTWGSLGTGPEHFSIAHAIAVDSKDRLYIADRNNARVQVYSAEGELLDSWQHLIIPWGLWITPDDDIWVCGPSTTHWADDPDNKGLQYGVPPTDQLVMKFNTEGKILQLTTFPMPSDKNQAPGQLNWVHCIALDPMGNLYLGDIMGKRVQKFGLVESAADSRHTGDVEAGSIFVASAEGVSVFDRDGAMRFGEFATSLTDGKPGELDWDDMVYDGWRLPTGNYLCSSHRYVRELTPDGAVRWEYRLEAPNELKSCVPLPNGDVMTVDATRMELVQVTDQGQREVKRIPVPTTLDAGEHNRYNLLRRTEAGTFLLALRAEKAFVEVDASGKELWRHEVPDLPIVAERLANGNTLMSWRGGLIEATPDYNVVWELKADEIEDFPVLIVGGFHRFANNNTLIANSDWHYGEPGENRVQLFEVNRDKHVVWTLGSDAFADKKPGSLEPKTGHVEHRIIGIQWLGED